MGAGGEKTGYIGIKTSGLSRGCGILFEFNGIRMSRASVSSRTVTISVHIPKCGGISFEHVLRRIYGGTLWRHYGADPDFEPGEAPAIPAGTRCIHGHFRSDTFDACVPRPELITWLRHPVERVVSNYFHFLRHPNPGNRCCRELLERNLSLQAFAELDGMRNQATRYLAGKPLGAFRFVGVTERFSDSLALFGAVFQVRIPRRPPVENQNPNRRSEGYGLPDRLYQHILALNVLDLAAYQSAVERLDRELALAASAQAHGRGAPGGFSLKLREILS